MNEAIIIKESFFNTLSRVKEYLVIGLPKEISDKAIGDELSEDLLQQLRQNIFDSFSTLVTKPENYIEGCYKAFLLYDLSQEFPPILRLEESHKDILLKNHNITIASYLLYRIPDRVLKYLEREELKRIQESLLGISSDSYIPGAIYHREIRRLDYHSICKSVGSYIKDNGNLNNSEIYSSTISHSLEKPLDLIQYWKGRKSISKSEYLKRKAIFSFWLGGYFQTYDIFRHVCSIDNRFSAQDAYYYIYSLSTISLEGGRSLWERDLIPEFIELLKDALKTRRAVSSLERAEYLRSEWRSAPLNVFVEAERTRIINQLSSQQLSEEDCYYLALIYLSNNNDESYAAALSILESYPNYPYTIQLKKLINKWVTNKNIPQVDIDEILGELPKHSATLDTVFYEILPAIHKNEMMHALRLQHKQDLWNYANLSQNDIERMHTTIIDDILDRKVFASIDKSRNEERITSISRVNKRTQRLNLAFSHNENYAVKRDQIASNIVNTQKGMASLNIHRDAVEDCLAVAIGNYQLREFVPYLLYIYYYYLIGAINTRVTYTLCMYLYEIYNADVSYRETEKQARAITASIPSFLGLKNLTIVAASLICPFFDIQDFINFLRSLDGKVHYYIPPHGDQLLQYNEFKKAAQAGYIVKNFTRMTLHEIPTADFSTKLRQLDAFLDSIEGENIPDLSVLDDIIQFPASNSSKSRNKFIIIIIIILGLLFILSMLFKLGILDFSLSIW